MKQERTDLFRRAFELGANYDKQKFDRPPRTGVSRDELLSSLGGPTPENGLSELDALEALVKAAEPGLQVSTGARFMGWVVGGSHPVGMAADWLTSVWGQNCANYECSPAASVSEDVTADWLKDLLSLPEECSVGFTTGATMANFTALAAARSEMLHRIGWNVELDGLQGAPRLRILIGDEAHTTVFTALSLLGFGRNQVKRVSTDDQGRMRVDALKESLEESDTAAIVIAQAGQINTGAMDPFKAILSLLKDRNAWLHVDGAFGLWALACPQLRSQLDGVDGADSWATDGHKWLQVPYDAGFVFVRHAEAHRRAMATPASYLPVQSDIRDPSHYVPELSRRSRAFAVWAIIKTLGREGISEMIIRHCHLAKRLAQQLSQVPGIEILNQVSLNQVIVGFSDDEQCGKMIESLARENRYLLGGATWHDRKVLRISIISWFIDEAEIDGLAEDIIRLWRELDA